ncbi:hypothetical protein F5887DRAFT_1061987 [Amanita rubescens]|nr:hypothetical protein F5887DRAFT_1061987 [Amanita rubescens]
MDIAMHGNSYDVEAVNNTLALGEEGTIDPSHEGGEFEVFENLAREIASSTGQCNETLLRNGCLGCSPLMPTVAFTVRTLSAYREMHRSIPRNSIEAFTKVIGNLHNVPFQPYLQKQFTDAFDIYLEICRRVDKKLDEKVGYLTPTTRLARRCPLCFYKLQDEPNLDFSVLVTMDGNNSLKRIGPTVRKREELFDSRTIDSDRWLTAEEVDHFKNEVAQRPEIPVNNPADFRQDGASTNFPNATTDDGDSSKCADRWKNAGPDQRKRMFGLFEETGIFIAACRHRTVLYGCDMIKSGELAKYPLAIVNRLMNEVGNNIGCAYDIGCTFQKTVQNSSLGAQAKAAELSFMVGAFHGYAHERACQLKWHPLYMKGTGRTEGEACEHIFSSSNDLARGTRHASRFHRHQAIDEHFKFWDQDKYAVLSTYIYNHYKEAVRLIKKFEDELTLDREALKCNDDDFKANFNAEKQYLSNLKKPDPVIGMKKEYARYRVEVSSGQVQNAEALATLYEVMLGIPVRWTADNAEYKQYYKENVETSFRESVDQLERLVVMRISEVTKLNQAGLGVKLREHIVGALSRRSESVRKAISRYNEQAALLGGLTPTVTWQEISKYTFVARSDIRQEKWVQKANHDAGIKYFKLCRAREEIQRLNVEVRRLLTWIHDEGEHMERVIKQLSDSEPLLADALRKKWVLRSSVNMIHLQRLKNLQNEDYYTGSRDSGEANDELEAEIEQDEDFQIIADYIANIND